MTISDIPMLIDSGADVTLVPQSAVDILKVDLSPDKSYELTGFEVSKAPQKSYSST
jgi:hypothetical protein